MDLAELLESPAFWILGIGGVGAEIAGFMLGKSWGLPAFPLWQFIVVIIGTIVAAAFFAMQE